jgi:hypothetical protein
MRFEREGDVVVLEAPAQMATVVRAIPGARHDAKRRVWTFPLSWATCVAARGVLGAQLEVGPELTAWARQERATRIDPALTLRDAQDVDEAWLARLAKVEG